MEGDIYKVKKNEQSDIKGFYCGNVCKPHFGAAKHGWLCIECFWNNYKWQNDYNADGSVYLGGLFYEE